MKNSSLIYIVMKINCHSTLHTVLVAAYLNHTLYAVTQGSLWCQQASGVSKPLVSASLWCQQASGVSKPLVSASLWYQQASGVSMALVSAWL
jgi:hypothetical protein